MRTLNEKQFRALDRLEKQFRALDRLEKRDPDTVVTGWSEKLHGPTVVRGDGRTQHLSHTGYLRKNEVSK